MLDLGGGEDDQRILVHPPQDLPPDLAPRVLGQIAPLRDVVEVAVKQEPPVRAYVEDVAVRTDLVEAGRGRGPYGPRLRTLPMSRATPRTASGISPAFASAGTASSTSANAAAAAAANRVPTFIPDLRPFHLPSFYPPTPGENAGVP